ncbi:hypothetical protein ABL78_0518 [Leptomonas seymouri]|uniref:Uncharacterized protein n=1 Tax=Leptomonas seymouri TaxID=5684 RepID=A0A0N1I8K0_LEPSE|nr:hypothetical protein ABL78_0518 [Leptomonas seymouri]|eukprot:KPI90292.1 hypothetical protein ABL78_0518 [Leptomonas seymouri]
MYHSALEANDAAYVDIRVCDLQIQYGNMPSALDSGFQVDGLYVVLRCCDEVRHTSCLWSSSASSLSCKGRLAAAALDENDENDWVWNELFRFVLPPKSPEVADTTPVLSHQVQGNAAAAAGNASSLTSPLSSAIAVNSCEGSSSAVLPMSTAGAAGAAMLGRAGAVGAPGSFSYLQSASASSSTPPLSGFHQQAGRPSPRSKASSSPFLHPAIGLELWRSTPNSENCLGSYTYHLPLELLHGGYGLHQMDVVAERVVPLRTKEAPSIMGNLYGWSGHRLSLRLRVQAVGLAPVTADWTLPTAATGMSSAGASGNYSLPYSFAMDDPCSRSTMVSTDYVSSMGNLNPVLANLLAPLGVMTLSGQGGPAVRPAPRVMGMGGHSNASLPPVFPLFLTSSSNAVLSAPANSSAQPASREQGVLGEGDPTWRGSVLPAVLPQ